MTSKKRNKSVLFFLTLLFIAPGLSAYLFYMHPEWLNHNTTNKGHFLNPAQPLNLFKDKKWRIVLWSPEACDHQCMHQLDQLARVRLALGRRFYNVELWLLQRDDAPALSKEALESIKEYNILWQTVSVNNPKAHAILMKKTSTFIINPTNYLILEYNNNQPDDVFHDIKHILTSSEASN